MGLSLRPDAAELHHYLRRLLEVLPRGPLQARMEVVFSGEQVRRGQSHEREPRSIGAAADWLLNRDQPDAANRLARAVDDIRTAVYHLAHVPIRLLHFQFDPGAGLGCHLARQTFDERLFVCESVGLEVANQHADAGAVHGRSNLIRVYVTRVTIGGFGRETIGGKAIDEARRGLDGVDHAPLRIPRVRVETDEGDAHRVR